jgi:ribonuclease T2
MFHVRERRDPTQRGRSAPERPSVWPWPALGSARGRRTAALLVLCTLAWGIPAGARVPLEGELVATRDCPATVSTKQRDPAGGVRLEPGRGYRLLGRNKADATHYQIAIEGARPPERWVEVGCGTLSGAHTTGQDTESDGQAGSPRGVPPAQGTTAATEPSARPARSRPGAFVLALSWQPAFCEVNRRKAECRDQTPQRPDASRFSLHGLWPQPRENAYCGVDGRTQRLDQEGDWSALPAPDLGPATRERLATLMPGARSGLDRHEWISHGTCYGTDADTYFDQAIALLEQVNASPIRALFADNRGRHLSSTQIRAAFDAAFGRGAGERVRLVCDAGMISELRLSLRGEIGDGSRIGPLMRTAVPLSPRCRGGRVDVAGFE